MRTLLSFAAAVALSIFLPFVSSGPGSNSTPPTQVRLTQIQTGFGAITDLQHAGDARLFVAEQGGLIRIIKNGRTLATPFLDISGRIVCCGERGLLGLAFHPQYATNGYFYVNYTYEVTPGGQLRSRVSRFSVSANADVADANSELILLEFNQPYTNHNGGALQFGPDGYLYIASGDGGDSYDPHENSQNTANLLGKVLRIDVNSTAGGSSCNLAANGRYGIPPGNPLADGAGGACDEIWAYGLRNPWRISFDRQTGDLWIADVGQGAREEVDFQAVGSAGGQNYGWDCFEGTLVNNTDRSPLCANNPPVVAPVHDYDHGGGRCSITGDYVYRGPALAGYTGAYFFADYCSDEMWTLQRTGGAPVVTKLTLTLPPGVTFANPRTFGQDAAGELYVATPSTVFRIENPNAAGNAQ